MKVWLLTLGEPIPTDSVRPMRLMGLASQLLALGHEVTIWASSFFHHTKTHRVESDTTIQVSPRYREVILKTWGYRANISVRRIFAHRHFAHRLGRAMPAHERPDIIVAGMPAVEIVGAAVKYGRRHGVPVVMDVIDPWPDVFAVTVPSWARPAFKLLLSPLRAEARAVIRHLQGVTGISSTYVDWALRMHGQPRVPSAVFYPAVDVESFDFEAAQETRWKPGPMRFLYAGALGHQYDVETIIRCARILRDAGVGGVEFLIAGSGPKLEMLRRLAADVPSVRMLGWLKADGLARAMAESHVGIACYARGATQSVTYKLFDYLGAGLPVLSSLPGEMAEILERERVGWFYAPEDAQALAAHVRRLAEDRDAVRQTAARGRAFAERRGHTGVVYAEMARFLEKVAGKEAGAQVRSRTHQRG